MLQKWRAKARFLAPLWFGRTPGFFARRLLYPELQETVQPPRPERPPYSDLAELFHDYSRARMPNYAGFLAELTRGRGAALRSVLDLACGAGTSTGPLAAVADEVTGLDVSDAMLKEARERFAALPKVRFVQGDFRHFQLDQVFDGAVCVSNSLNYVQEVSELQAVFGCVANHLRPGGLFVFDILTEKGMRTLAGSWLHVERDGKRFAIHFHYDAQKRQEESQVLLPGGIEVHRRIPLEPVDVTAAAGAAGLAVVDYFSFASLPGRWATGPMVFFVLERR